MHEAYEVIHLVKKLPPGLCIETIAAYDDFLFVGTRSGSLLFYQLIPAVPGKPSKSNNCDYEVHLLRSNKAFSKKTITQIEVVPDFKMLICLADNIVSAFDLSQFSLMPLVTLSKTKGAHHFAINVSKHEIPTGEIQKALRLCVAVKKKLQVYYWKAKDMKFLEFSPDMNLPDIPKKIVWCEESLVIGFKSEYSLIKIDGTVKELFPLGGKQLEPLITQLPDNQLAIGSNEQTVLIDSEGFPTLKHSIKWSQIPADVSYDMPYLIALLSSSVEVRSLESRLHVQSMEIPQVKAIAPSKRGWVYVASGSDVWLLRSISFLEQITKLQEENQFELAVRLAKMTDDPELDTKHLIQRIENLHAFFLFLKQEFKEAMDYFFRLETDPSHVIGLFPNLLPDDFRSKLEYPDKLPSLQGIELENGLLALTDYLVQVRRRLKQDLENNVPPAMTAIVEGSDTIRSKKQLLQIIDTTLLKCYLQTNDALAASLLRVKDNYCHIEESERALRKREKYNELLILYDKKGMHRKALDLLMRQAKKADSPLKGHERTVHYLQQLGKDNLELLFEYSKWILKEFPEDGLKIFTEEYMDRELLPRDEVYTFLQATEPDLVIPYLEHVIHMWNDDSKVFHNSLIWRYCEKIAYLKREYMISLPESHHPALAGHEPGELGKLRSKLLHFLATSQHYTIETFAMHLLHDRLHEEGAVVLGRLGRHEEALIIYTHVLQDMKKAELYCERNYNPDKPGDKDVYFHLLKLYMVSSDTLKMDFSGAGFLDINFPKPNLDMALKVLTKYAEYIDIFKAVHILPSDVTISSIREFLKSVLHKTQAQKRHIKLEKSLLYAENLQFQFANEKFGLYSDDAFIVPLTHVLLIPTNVQAQRIHYQSFKLGISDLDVCRVCQKRIGKSAFARFPTGILVHYSCKDQFVNI